MPAPAWRSGTCPGRRADDLYHADGGGIRHPAHEDDDGNTVYGVLDQPARFWAIFGMTVAGIVVFALLWHFCRQKRRWGSILMAATLGFSLLYGTLHLSLTKYAQWDTDSNLIAETYEFCG